jgi:hypothetical protein
MALRRFLFQSDEAYADTASLTDETELGKLTLTGIGGIAVDAGNARIVNVGDPTGAQDAATKNYVDTVQSGLTVKAPARVVAVADVTIATPGATIDGKTLVALDRILLVGQTNKAENGLYVFDTAATPLVRATDLDSTAEYVPGAYVFINEGDNYGHTAWVVTNDTAITVGTTLVDWVQFSGLGQVVAGAGMTSSGNTLDVGKGDGIAVGADAISIDLDTAPALALNGTSPNKKLAFLPDTTRGIGKDASGAYVKLPTVNPGIFFDGTGNVDAKLDSAGGLLKDALGIGVRIASPNELTKDASGIHVVGLPSLFKIGGTPVGAAVTATNLDTITNGSNADALHTHTAAATVPLVEETWTANGNITKGHGVYVSAANAVSHGDCSNDTKSRCIGVAGATVSDTLPTAVVVTGVVQSVLTGATPGTRYFLGATTGAPVLVGALPGGARTIQLGIAKNATDLAVRVFDFGKKAA